MRPYPYGYAANEGGSGGLGGGGGCPSAVSHGPGGGGGGWPSAVILGLTRPTATPTATEPTANRLLTNNRLIVRFICFSHSVN